MQYGDGDALRRSIAVYGRRAKVKPSFQKIVALLESNLPDDQKIDALESQLRLRVGRQLIVCVAALVAATVAQASLLPFALGFVVLLACEGLAKILTISTTFLRLSAILGVATCFSVAVSCAVIIADVRCFVDFYLLIPLIFLVFLISPITASLPFLRALRVLRPLGFRQEIYRDALQSGRLAPLRRFVARNPRFRGPLFANVKAILASGASDAEQLSALATLARRNMATTCLLCACVGLVSATPCFFILDLLDANFAENANLARLNAVGGGVNVALSLGYFLLFLRPNGGCAVFAPAYVGLAASLVFISPCGVLGSLLQIALLSRAYSLTPREERQANEPAFNLRDFSQADAFLALRRELAARRPRFARRSQRAKILASDASDAEKTAALATLGRRQLARTHRVCACVGLFFAVIGFAFASALGAVLDGDGVNLGVGLVGGVNVALALGYLALSFFTKTRSRRLVLVGFTLAFLGLAFNLTTSFVAVAAKPPLAVAASFCIHAQFLQFCLVAARSLFLPPESAAPRA